MISKNCKKKTSNIFLFDEQPLSTSWFPDGGCDDCHNYEGHNDEVGGDGVDHDGVDGDGVNGDDDEEEVDKIEDFGDRLKHSERSCIINSNEKLKFKVTGFPTIL